MRNLSVLFVACILAVTACAPAPSTAINTPPRRTPTPTFSNPTSDAPLAEGLLLVRYDNKKDLNLLSAIDPANGYELSRAAPLSLGQEYYYALSPDRKTLAALVFQSQKYPHGGDLYLINLADWSVRKISLAIKEWGSQIAYAPDGQLIAIASNDALGTLTLVDVAHGQARVSAKTGWPIHNLKFSADGKTLLIYAVPQDPSNGVTNGDPRVGALDVSDLRWKWSADLSMLRDGVYPKEGMSGDLHAPGNAYTFVPGLAFAPDKDLLYIVNAEKDELISVDFSAMSIDTREIHTEMSWSERLLGLFTGVAYAKALDGTQKSVLISPDGRQLYVIGTHNEFKPNDKGNPDFTQTPLGLQVVRTSDAVETGKFDTQTGDMALSADGQLLYLHAWSETEVVTAVFDTTKNKITASLSGYSLIPTRRLDGRPALVSGYVAGGDKTQLGVFDPGSTQPGPSWLVEDYASWLSLP